MKRLSCLIMLLVLGINTTNALAGGVDNNNNDAFPPIYAGLYLQLGVGYTWSAWRDYASTPFTSVDTGAHGGFSYAPTLGYRFNRFLALEGTWINLTRAKGTAVATAGLDAGNLVNLKVSSWILYAAIKGMVPLFSENFYGFAKFGAAYRCMTLSPSGSFLNNQASYWAPLFGVGFAYYVSDNFSVSLQYLHVSGYNHVVTATTTDRLNTPAAHILLFGFSYQYSV